MKEIVISPLESGQRFDKFLGKYLTGAGRSFLYKMLRKKNITLNDKKAIGSEILIPGDNIKIYFSDETFEKFKGEDLQEISISHDYNLDIIFEDENIIIANKPAGILSQKSRIEDISFNDLIIDYIKKNSDNKETFRAFTPSIANRLDRNTSGIILVGKTLKGLQSLSKSLKDRTIDKYYLAICEGEISENISFEGYIKKDVNSNLVTISTNENDGDKIVTKVYSICVRNGFTLVKIKLITGKTHQIRATLKALNHPIIGDRKYQGTNTIKAKRQMLHAYEVVLEDNSYIAKIPNDFKALMNELELDIKNYGNI